MNLQYSYNADVIMSTESNNKKVSLNLFVVVDARDCGQGRIKVLTNENLRNFIKELISRIQAETFCNMKEIAGQLGLKYMDLYNNLSRNRICLTTLKRLLIWWGRKYNKPEAEIENMLLDLQSRIDILSYGAGNTHKIVKFPHSLTENLCKIAGAIVADGYLGCQISKTNNRQRYVITVDDQYKDNMKKFCKWIYEEFRLKLKLKYNEPNNYWRVDFCDKIVHRVLNRIFAIPSGRKDFKIELPPIIENNFAFTMAFLKGYMLFECGVGIKKLYWNISTKSTRMFEFLNLFLKQQGIEPDSAKDYRDITCTYEIRIWNKEKMKQIFDLFGESESIKWARLYAGVYKPIDINKNQDNYRIERI